MMPWENDPIVKKSTGPWKNDPVVEEPLSWRQGTGTSGYTKGAAGSFTKGLAKMAGMPIDFSTML